MTGSVAILVLGLALLALGGESLVRGAARLAERIGVSPLVVGLTVVAFGTSAPELGVSVLSAVRGQAGIAVGNVVGSNIFNVLVVLGLSALVAPLAVGHRVVRLEAPLGVAVTVLLIVLVLDGSVGRLDGALLLLGIVAYSVWAVRKSRSEATAAAEGTGAAHPPAGRAASLPVQAILVAGGLGLLVVGSAWFVDGASAIAKRLGVSDISVGLTIVAAGTSLPELATSVVAAIRGERDIAVGNVIGSNLYNVMAVLGASGVVAPRGIPVPAEVLRFDLWVMLGVSVLVLPALFSGYKISRWEGGAFVSTYALYVACQVLSASGHPGLAGVESGTALFLAGMLGVMVAVALGPLLLRKPGKPAP